MVLFQLALIWNFFSRSLPPQDFFFSSFSCLLESGGLYCCNLNLDTRHNLIVWNRLQTKFFSFSASLSRFALLSKLYSKYQTHLNAINCMIFCVGFPHTLSGAAIFLSLFICMRQSVVTWSLAVRERTLGMRKLYAFRQKNYHRFVSPQSFALYL